MGYSLAWLAVHGIPYDATLERLALGKTDEFADYAEQDFTGRAIPNGWSVVVARGCNDRIIGTQQLASLSLGCDVIACSVEEHVMFSFAELWSDGQRVWRVEHDAQKGIDHISSEGALPGYLEAVRRQYTEQQEAAGGTSADGDFYFEIPPALAQARVGFKHDEENDFDSEGSFQVLADLG